MTPSSFKLDTLINSMMHQGWRALSGQQASATNGCSDVGKLAGNGARKSCRKCFNLMNERRRLLKMSHQDVSIMKNFLNKLA